MEQQKSIPIGFHFEIPSADCDSHDVVVNLPAGHVVVGLWTPTEPRRVTIDSIIVAGREVTRCPVDAASFDAAPRADGQPRMVEVGSMLETESLCETQLVMSVRALWSNAVPTDFSGHIVVRRKFRRKFQR